MTPTIAVSGSVTGTISSHEVNLEITCKTQGDNLAALSKDPVWADEDTNGDGHFFIGGVLGGVAAFVYINGKDKFTFGDHKADHVNVSPDGMIYREKDSQPGWINLQRGF